MSQRSFGTSGFLSAIKSLIAGNNPRKTSRVRLNPPALSELLETRALLSSNSIGEDFLQYQSLAPTTVLKPVSGFLSAPNSGAPIDIATSYLQANAGVLGLTPEDITSLQVTNNYQSSGSGITHIYFQQVVNSIPVINSTLNISISSSGQVITVGSSILDNVRTTTPAPNPQLSATEALNSVVTKLGWVYEGTSEVLQVNINNPTKDTVLSSAGISMVSQIPASLRYLPTATGELRLAWLMNVQTTDTDSWYDVSVSAQDGQILHMVDWANNASYHAVQMPNEHPQDGVPTLIVDPQLKAPNASPFGWHDTNGAVGAEFTDTRGNNVNAQEDINADNTGGRRPDGGANLVFNFPFNPSQSATQNENSSIVNVFYWTNIIHDVLYVYGFDEVSGNFQSNNYGKGGVGGDQVEADALDGSGTNNANFATPPDGTPGRMQMFEFTLTTPTRDSGMDGTIISHEYGHGLTNRLTGGPANAGALVRAQSRGMGEGWSDFLSLMMTQKPSDTQFAAYPVGNYVLGNPLNDPNGGIRTFPYSFNMSINPTTYGRFNPNTAPHPNGEIIASALWDLNWLFINGDGANIAGKGYEADIYLANSGAGNTELMQLFIEALKLQPANPTNLNFRDAMLAADLAMNGGANEFAIWTAFARRGMGFSAFDGGPVDIGIREAFDLPPGLRFDLTISPSPVAENAGVGGATVTISRAASLSAFPLDVTLTSNDLSELQVPATVTIPAGVATFSFPVNVIDDTLLDGPQDVLLTANATIGGRARTAQATVTVQDVELLTITVNPASIVENAGSNAGTVTVTRTNTDTLPPDTFAIVNNQLLRHDFQGNLVSTVDVAWPGGPRPVGENAHDLVILQNGRIAVYNGTTQGNVSVFNPATSLWQHFSIPGLSTSATDVALGGITAWGNYVFLSDMQSASGNPFGAVRLDLATGAITRFADKSFEDRLFVKDIFSNSINEIDLATGATINSIPMPVSNNFGFDTGMAFDGTDLWVLAGPINNDIVYQIDADTGAIKQTHSLGGNNGWDGLAFLNGLLYAQDDFIQNRITVYNPATRQVVNTFQIDRNISGGLAAITGPDALISASTFINPATGSHDLYEIDPINGAVRFVFSSGSGSTPYGIGSAGNQIYVGVFQGSNLRAFNRDRTFDRLVPISTTGVPGVYAIGGDDIKSFTTTKFRYRDVFAGLDNQLYVLDEAGFTVGRYNPETLELDRFFKVPNRINAVAVADDGTLWGAGANGTLYHFSSTGTLLGSTATGSAELIDIDLNITGQILLTSRDGNVIQSDTLLTTVTTFSAGTSTAFVSLGRFQTLPAGAIIVQLTNSDPSEVSIPVQVIIPIGQQSVTVPLHAVDDNILDDTQTVTITATAVGYSNTPTDTIDVLDAEILGVDIIAPQISESAGAAATQVRVFRTNVDGPFDSTFRPTSVYANTNAQTILDNNKITSTITIPQEVSRLTDVNVTLDINHSWLADLDIFLVSPAGTRVELVTDLNRNEPFLTNTTFDDRGLIGILAGAAPFTGTFRPEGSLAALNGENPSGLWTLEITDDNPSDVGTLFSWSLNIATLGLAPQPVTLTRTGATGKIGVQSTVTIPANQAEITIPLDAIDNTLLDGTQVAGVKASALALGYSFGEDDVTILDDETLLFTLNRTSVSENVGIGAVRGTVERKNTDLSLPFTFNVTSSNPAKLSVPATVTIPAFATSIDFNIDTIDNNIFDGDVSVLITVSAPEYGADKTATVLVTDLEPSLSLTTTASLVREDSGSFVLTVSRLDQSNMSLPMTVNLAVSSVPVGSLLSLSLPASVTIPANATSTTVSVSVLDDTLLNGTRTFRITGTAAGIATGTNDIQVADFETLTVTSDKSSFLENGGTKAARGTVRRSNTDTSSPLVVTLTSSDLTEITVPVTVTIPANASSASFDIAAVDDPLVDGPQTAVITAASAGYESVTASLSVLDHEPPVITAPSGTTAAAKPTVTWLPVAGALKYELQIANVSSSVRRLVLSVEITGTTFTPPEQLGIGRYRVWVRAVDSLEQRGFWSVGTDFTIVTAPTITSPLASGSAASPTFPTISWTAVADAPEYELWVNNVTTGASRVIFKTGLDSTSYISTEGLGSGTYRAWVRASNSFNEFGNWSAPVTFSVLAPPGVLTPTSGGTFDRTPTITWSSVFSATTYDIMVTATPSNTVAFRNQSVTGTTITLPNDLVNGDYSIVVRARSGAFLSNWSAPRLISVGTPPRISNPLNNSAPGSKPTFNWTTITGTERYEIFIQNMTTNTVVLNQKTTTNSYTSTTALAAGQYRVWVRAISTMGEKTLWSAPVNFTVAATGTSPVISPETHGVLLVSALPRELTMQNALSKTAFVNAAPAATSPAVDNQNLAVATAAPAANGDPSSDINLAHDAVMALWDMSEWWNGDAGIAADQGLESDASSRSTVARLAMSERQFGSR